MAHFLTRDQGDRGDVGGKEVHTLGVLLCFVWFFKHYLAVLPPFLLLAYFLRE